MNYCTLEDAWGNQFKESRKKKKKKNLYTSKLPKRIYDRSYEEGGHDENCSEENKRNFTIKNKHRYEHSRNSRDIYNKKKPSRVNNVNIVYDNANKEYKKYKKESKRNTRNKISRDEYIENNRNQGIDSNFNVDMYSYDGNIMHNNYYTDTDGEESEYENINENENMILEENRHAQNQINMQRDIVQRQMNMQGLSESPTYTLNDDRNESENNMDNIEGFEANDSNLNSLDINNSINDVDSYPLFQQPAPSPYEETTEKNNLLDDFLKIKNNSNKDNIEDDSEDDSEEETDEEIETNLKQNNINKGNINKGNINKVNANKITKKNKKNKDNNKLEIVNENSKDIDYRLNTLNRNVNLIIKKMNNSQFFEDDSQDNIHDLILFILFGIFIIFVLDTIYRFGRNSKK